MQNKYITLKKKEIHTSIWQGCNKSQNNSVSTALKKKRLITKNPKVAH